MIIEYVHFNVPTAQAQDFDSAWARAQQSLFADPNCIRHEISRCVERPDRWIARIEWSSDDGQPKSFKTVAQKIGPFVEAVAEAQHYQPR